MLVSCEVFFGRRDVEGVDEVWVTGALRHCKAFEFFVHCHTI